MVATTIVANSMDCSIGIGYGLYVTVDYALLLDVLPDKANRGNDIAVWHQVLLQGTSLLHSF